MRSGSRGWVYLSGIGACIAVVACGSPAPDRGESVAARVPNNARVLMVGDTAPDFLLPGSDGKEYSLAAYQGKQAVVLAWFSKAFTEG